MKDPFFSIIIPTYERRDIVCDALRAICHATGEMAVEVIVVVDGSSDGTEEAVKALPCTFPKKIIVQGNNGLAAARNRGAAEAGGEILLFLDDDMMAQPDLLQQHASSHASGAEVVLGHIPVDPGSPESFLAEGVRNWADRRAANLQRDEPTLFDLVSGHLSIRRELFEKIGGYDEAFNEGGSFGDEDLDFAVRLIATGALITFNPDAIAYQRYVVTPRQNLRQWTDAGRSDVRFSRKHPAYGNQLFQLHGRDRWTTRLLLRPIAAIPAVPDALAAAATWIAEREHRLPKALRRPVAKLFTSNRDILYWRAVRRAGGIPSVDRALVLCYHAIADLSGDPVLSEYGIDLGIFVRQLDSLLRRGFIFISPDEFDQLLAGRRQLPARAVLVTFDDCYEELAVVARDILQPRNIQALAFAVSGMQTGTNEWDQRIGARKLRLLTGDQLRELTQRGVEIGCHSKSHAPLTKLPDKALSAETRGAAEELAASGLRRPRFFAYPHGDQDQRVRAAVRRAGFSAAFGLTPSLASSRSDRLDIPRVEIFARDGDWRFWLKTTFPRLAALLRAEPLHIRARGRIARSVKRLKAGSAG